MTVVERLISDEWGFATEQVHAGATPDAAYGARITPVYLSNGFVFNDFDDARERFAGDGGYYYTRDGNPTTTAVERKLAALEHGAASVVLASGQAALTVAFLTLAGQGDHIVAGRSLYEGTRGLLRENLAGLGIATSFVSDPSDPLQLEAAIRPTTKAVFVETIPNPNNDIPDLEAVANVAHAHGIPLVVDNTFATPYLVRPIEYGADVVVHSTSKFLSGHGSSIGGAIVDAGTVDDFTPRARALAGRLGPTPSPFTAFLLQQGVETLSLRVRQHSTNALAIAEALEARDDVTEVGYSGLRTSPYFERAQRYLPRGQGAVFTVTLAGGEPAARRLINGVELFSRMTHVGDVRSLILHPASTTHAHLSPSEQTTFGIAPGTVRLSVGIEDAEDLIRDLEQGLRA